MRGSIKLFSKAWITMKASNTHNGVMPPWPTANNNAGTVLSTGPRNGTDSKTPAISPNTSASVKPKIGHINKNTNTPIVAIPINIEPAHDGAKCPMRCMMIKALEW